MTELSAAELEDLLPGYVLGILEPDELAQVEDTLAAHPAYAARVMAVERAAAWLPYAAPPAPALRPEVKEHTMALIRREPRAKARPVATPPPPAWPGLREWWRGMVGRGGAPLLAALSLALAVVLGGQLNTSRQQAAQIATLQAANTQRSAEINRLTTTLTQREADLAQLTTGLAQREAEVTRLTTQLSQRQAEVNALMGQLAQAQQAAQAAQQQISLVTRASQVVSLVAVDPGVGAAAGRVYVTDDNRALALVQGLPPAPTGRTYQLWGIGGPGNAPPASMGTYAVDNQGQGTWVVDPAIVAGPFAAFGVTQEPQGGSQTPTLPILLLGQRTS